MTSQMVNPAVLRAHDVAVSMSHRTERYGSLPVNVSTTPAYAAHQPPTSQVVVKGITRKTDPHLGSMEFYTSGMPGTVILRRYNNIFIPQLSPY